MARHALFALVWIVLGANAARGQQTTAFTYQGQLTNAGQPANGNFDLQFALFDSTSAGTQIGSTLARTSVAISGGVFTVQLDFGVSAFPGANRFLEIGVRPAGGGSYTTLAPRQQISSTPYAIRTLAAATADALSSACMGCVTNAQIGSVAGSKVTGTIPAASVPTGSGNYVQNTTTPQAANFNISGNGTVGGNLTVTGTLNANVSGNFIQNRTSQQSNASFNVGGNGTVGGTLAASSVTAGPPAQYAPQLDVNGTAWVRGDSTPLTGHGKGLAAGFNGTSGYLFAFDYGSATPLNLLLDSPGGNVGVGTVAPTARLDVGGGSGTGVHAASTGGRGVWGDSGTYQGVYGHSTGNAGVVGESDKFDGLFGVSHDPNNSGVFANNDNSGFGVSGFTNAAHTVTKAGVYGESTGDGGIGVIGEADTGGAWGVYGVSASPTGVGVVGNATAGGIGVSGSAEGGGFALAASGNTTQTLTSGGWVKAMVNVDDSGAVVGCFNSFASNGGAGSPNCGFSEAGGGLGIIHIGFPFAVCQRFVSITSGVQSGSAPGDFHFTGANYGCSNGVAINGGDRVDVFTFYVANHAATGAAFSLIVF